MLRSVAGEFGLLIHQFLKLSEIAFNRPAWPSLLVLQAPVPSSIIRPATSSHLYRRQRSCSCDEATLEALNMVAAVKRPADGN
jgi:hypothetical protein